MRSLSTNQPNSERCHIKGRPTTSDTVTSTSHNLQRRTKQLHTNSHKAVAELHPLVRSGSNFTTVSWVGHVLYVHKNLHLLANVNSCSCSLYIVVRQSVCRLSVTLVHPTQPMEIFGNVSAPFNTLVTWRHPGKILRRSSQRNPSVGGLNQTVVEKCSDFGPFRDYILETVQDRRQVTINH